MATFKYNPTTPSRRHMSAPSFEEVTKFEPEKSLLATKKKHAGRNSYGKITVRHKGGGNRQKYRIIDFKRDKEGNEILVPDTNSVLVLDETSDGSATVAHEQKKKVEDDQTPDVPAIFTEWKKQEGISW